MTIFTTSKKSFFSIFLVLSFFNFQVFARDTLVGPSAYIEEGISEASEDHSGQDQVWEELVKANENLEALSMGEVAGAPALKEYSDPSKLISRIVVDKNDYTLKAYNRAGKLLLTYITRLGGNPRGQKLREGDNKTPEGTYTLGAWNNNSKFHRSIDIPYPTAADRARSRKAGVPEGEFGDHIKLHGVGPSYLNRAGHVANVNWTEGCIAVTDAQIDEIYRRINRKVVEPVTITILPMK